MSAGLPSVVSDIPANLQLVDESVHGRTAPWDDEEEIAKAFVALFGDSHALANMGAAARARVIDNYSMEKVVFRYETLFRQAIEDQRIR
jgi:glycosyltransferase involved in cell wall biosynthesis